MNDSVLTLSVGQALEVQDALRRQGLSLSFLKGATSANWFSQLNDVMEGRAEIVPFKKQPVVIPVPSTVPDTFRVNYSIRATYPDWMRKRMHPEFDRTDTVEHDLAELAKNLWLHEKQQNDGVITGKELYQSIKDRGILPTCLALRDLEEIQTLGLETFRRYFRDKAIFAWKDVVRRRGAYLFVPYLIEHDLQVFLDWSWLGDDRRGLSPALRVAS